MPTGSLQPQLASATGLGTAAPAIARLALLAFGVSALYYLGGRLGLALRFPGSTIAPIWPANGVLLLAMLLTPPRRWWIWILAVLPAHLLLHAPLGVPLLRQSLQVAHNYALTAGAAFALHRLLGGRPRLHTLGEVGVFLATVAVAAVVAGMGLSATFAALGLADDFWRTARLIACSNLLVFVTLVPAVVVTLRSWRAWAAAATGWPAIEAALLAATLLLVSGLVYARVAGADDNIPALVYVPLPLLLWAAVRFGPGGISIATTALMLMAIWQVSHGRGPFLGSPSTENIFNLQTYFLAFAAPLMLLAALMDERRRAALALVELNADLEVRVTARTDELAGTNRQLEAARDQAEQNVARLKHEIAERQRAEADLRLRVAELVALNQIARALTGWVSLSSSLETVGPLLRGLFNAGTVTVWTRAAPNGGLCRVVAVADDASSTEPLIAPPDCARAALSGPDLALDLYDPGHPLVACPGLSPGHPGPFPTLIVTLRAQGAVAGLLCIRGSHRDQVYLSTDMALAQTVGSLLAGAVDNARRHAEARAAAAEEERQRLARDLHDSVSQTLFAANRIAEALPELWELDPEVGHDALHDLSRFTGSALAEMRALLLELRPAALTDVPLHQTLSCLTPALVTKERLAVEADLDPAPLLAPHTQVMLYRIAQEALNNVAKHARATRVTLCLKVVPAVAPGRDWEGAVTITVSDNGQGFDPARVRAGSMGLASLRERAADIGADLEIASAVGGGTQLRVTWRGAAPASLSVSS